MIVVILVGPLKKKRLTMINLSYIIPDMKTNTDNKTEERKNRFSGESIMLTKEEAKIHDRLFINELAATLEDKAAGFDGASKLWDKVRADINWFTKHNAKAYMVLLD
jgi:hypothetical protein